MDPQRHLEHEGGDGQRKRQPRRDHRRASVEPGERRHPDQHGDEQDDAEQGLEGEGDLERALLIGIILLDVLVIDPD